MEERINKLIEILKYGKPKEYISTCIEIHKLINDFKSTEKAQKEIISLLFSNLSHSIPPIRQFSLKTLKEFEFPYTYYKQIEFMARNDKYENIRNLAFEIMHQEKYKQRKLLTSTQSNENFNINRLKKDLWFLGQKYLKIYNPREGFHSAYQVAVSDLAKFYNLKGYLEYEFIYKNYNKEDKQGFIDVVWANSKKPLVSIEIDTGRKRTSLQKLIEIESSYCIWIYVGGNYINEILTEYGELKDDILSIQETRKKINIINL